MPARFFRFPRGPFISLAACKKNKQTEKTEKTRKKERKQEKEDNAVVGALSQVSGGAQCGEVFPVTEGRFYFLLIMNDKKNWFNVCGPRGMFSPAT